MIPPPPPEDSHPERFSLKTSFLAVVIAPVPFLVHVTYFITREKLKTGAKGGETKKKWRWVDKSTWQDFKTPQRPCCSCYPNTRSLTRKTWCRGSSEFFSFNLSYRWGQCSRSIPSDKRYKNFGTFKKPIYTKFL